MHPGGKIISLVRSQNGCWLKRASISFANSFEAAILLSDFGLVCLIYNAFWVLVIATDLIFILRSLAGLVCLRITIRLWPHDPFGGSRFPKFAPMGLRPLKIPSFSPVPPSAEQEKMKKKCFWGHPKPRQGRTPAPPEEVRTLSPRQWGRPLQRDTVPSVSLLV